MRLREYRRRYVRLLPDDLLKDRIALIPDLEYRPEELNLYSEVDPLQGNVPPLRDNSALRYVVTHHKREIESDLFTYQ